MTNTNYTGLEIAVIGMAGKFPGADNLDQFWKNILEGKSSMKPLSDEELLASGLTEEEIRNPDFVKMSARIEGNDLFDSAFFGYSPDEATVMEPQIRLLHQCVWHAIEDAGIAETIKKVPVGFFTGASHNFEWEANGRFFEHNPNMDQMRASTLQKAKFVHSLIAYNLGLKGPASYVDTACSTSLLAIHLASRSLLTGDAKIAIAGGVALKISKKLGYIYSENGIASNDGQCRSFNVGSTGTIGGEGVGVVVLKKLQDALKDGDHIHAVIKGSAVNNDGKRKVGFTAPSVEGQSECIRLAQKMARVTPESISYIESHGSATKLGDQIEANALKQVFEVTPAFSCPIGSVKSNIGHLDTAAGVAGFIKTVLMLKNKQMPRAVHADHPLPELSWESGKFYLNTDQCDWQKPNDHPLRAGINSFGIGGTNVHVVLEEAPEQPYTGSQRTAGILTYSAKTTTAFDKGIKTLKAFIEGQDELALPDLAYSLQTGRTAFPFRGSLAFNNKADLLDKLDKLVSRRTKDRSDHVIFVFSGIGSYYQGVCKELYAGEPLFKELFDNCAEDIRETLNVDIKTYLLDTGKEADIEVQSYLLFAIEYTLAKLLIQLEIKPKAMIGYSFGEYIAACIAGVMDVPTALKLLQFRNRVIADGPAGRMLSVPIPFNQLQGLLEEGVYLSIDNGNSCVVAGLEEVLKAFEQKMIASRILCTWLKVDKPMHSPLFDIDEMTRFVSGIQFNQPSIPYLSCVTGTWITEEDLADPTYWSKHLSQSVWFAKGLNLLLEDERNLFVEIGIGSDVSAIVSRELSDRNRNDRVMSFVRPEATSVGDLYYFAFQLAKIWQYGVAVNWKSWYSPEKHTLRSLPGYSFDPFVYPAEVDIMSSINQLAAAFDTGKLGTTLSERMFYPLWKLHTPLKESNSYTEHVIFNTPETEALCESLIRNGDTVIRVACGTQFKKQSSDQYELDFRKKEDYDQLFQSLAEDGYKQLAVTYAWNLLTDGKTFEADPDNREFHLAFLAPAQIAASAHHHCPGSVFTLITSGLVEVTGAEKERTYTSSLSRGLLSVIPQEFALRVRHVDIESPKDAEQLVKLIRHSVSERTFALRNKRLWFETYERSEPFTDYKHAIKNKGTYMVIGGTGRLGEILTNQLLRNYDAHLIIIGRREEALLSEELEALRTLGGQVTYISADIADKDSFARAFSHIEELGLQLDGIVHAGPSPSRDNYELLEDLTPTKACKIIHPKVNGIRNLYSLTRDLSLDFVWVASSTAAVLGGVSYGSYAASCSFADHFIQAHQAELSNWSTVQVGLFDRLADEDNTEFRMNPHVFMNRQELFRTFEATTIRDGGIIVAIGKENMTADMKAAQEVPLMNAQNTAEDTLAVERINRERPDLTTTYKAPETPVETTIVEIVGELFGMSGIGIDDNFLELGGNSIVAVILVRKIKAELNVVLTINDILANNTLGRIAALIDDIKIISERTVRTSKLEI